MGYHPDYNLAKEFYYCKDAEGIIWDFSIKTSQRLKYQIFTVLNYALENFSERKLRRGYLAPLHFFYVYCIDRGISDLTQLEQNQIDEYFSKAKEVPLVNNRYPQIVDKVQRILFLQAKDINWDANVWYLERFQFDITRYDPTRPVKRMGKNLQEDAAPIKYLRLLLRYLEPEDKRSEWEKDVWKLENFGFEVRQNPIDVIRTIKFTGIIQETIREEVKRASYIRIKYLSVGSLQGEIRAVRRFSEFLAKRNPEIKSLGEVGRLNIEEYLTYINLERGQERNLKTEMANLKNMLQQVGKVIDKPKLGKLFIKQDMPKAPEVAFKIYSDEEIKRLNYYIVNMEEQVARALILHQMLGGRISDTLTLRTDCLYQENGHYIVRMYQVKTSYYEKPIPDDVAKLIQKSMEYTYERYGETEYVFVNESNPSLPFQYSMLKHRVYTLIHENDICKDNGERMGFATHLFRHCYGMKLVELHLDDAAIAHLLGHRGVNTVYRYRRASGKLLVKETEELRKTMDEILSEIIKEWDGYEQVFQNG